MNTIPHLIERDKTYISLNMTQESLIKGMRRQGLNIDKVIKSIVVALEATKYKELEGDFYDTGLPDHATRLKAAGMAIDLMHLKQAKPLDQNDKNTLQKSIKKKIDSSDEVELQRILFKKNKEQSTTVKAKAEQVQASN